MKKEIQVTFIKDALDYLFFSNIKPVDLVLFIRKKINNPEHP